MEARERSTSASSDKRFSSFLQPLLQSDKMWMHEDQRQLSPFPGASIPLKPMTQTPPKFHSALLSLLFLSFPSFHSLSISSPFHSVKSPLNSNFSCPSPSVPFPSLAHSIPPFLFPCHKSSLEIWGSAVSSRSMAPEPQTHSDASTGFKTHLVAASFNFLRRHFV